MNYINTIKTAVITFPFIAFLFTIPFILGQYHKYGSIHKWRVVIIYSFILYLITAYFMVILPLPSIEEVSKLTTPSMNLIPFSFVENFLDNTSFVWNQPQTYLKALTEPCFYVVAFNIVLTIPFGMYLRYYYQCSLKKTIFLSFLLSLFFELTQLSGLYFIYPRSYRLFDVDDLILNTLGGVIGYFIMGLFSSFLPSRKAIDARSYEIGLNVSGLRRITLFFLDLFLFVICLGLAVLLFSPSYPVITTAFVYYVVIPVLFDGKTLGGKFLNVKMVIRSAPIIWLSLRMLFLFFFYFLVPILVVMFAIFLKNSFALDAVPNILFFLGTAGFLFFFYFFLLVFLLRRKKIFYDRWFPIRFQSTILEKKRDFSDS